jgi:murein DD-endopeptidase MepM/ murein hydrolase activator NlpD
MVESQQTKKKRESSKLSKNIKNIQSKIRSIESDIKSTNRKISETEANINLMKIDLGNALEAVNQQDDNLNARLRTMYKMGQVGYIDIVLGADSFENLLTRVNLLQRIAKNDAETLEALKVQKDEVVQKKEALENYLNELDSYKNDNAKRQRTLDSSVDNLEVEQGKLKKDLKSLEAEEDRLLEDARAITRIIEQYTSTDKYAGGKMAWPAPGYTRVTSKYGYRIHPVLKTRKLHTGMDIGVPTGGKIVAAQSGTIIYADWYGSYGKAVIIDHGGGYTTLYAHNSSLKVKKNQKVAKGQTISLAGSTGRSTGPHLHFEVRVKGKTVDPYPWVTKK